MVWGCMYVCPHFIDSTINQNMMMMMIRNFGCFIIIPKLLKRLPRLQISILLRTYGGCSTPTLLKTIFREKWLKIFPEYPKTLPNKLK